MPASPFLPLPLLPCIAIFFLELTVISISAQTLDNGTAINLLIDQHSTIRLPALPTRARFLFVINALQPPSPSPLPSPSPSSPSTTSATPVTQTTPNAPTQNTIIVVELVSPYPHRTLLTATTRPPTACPQSKSPLPEVCFQPITDKTSYLTRSSRAFLKLTDLPAGSPAYILVQNADRTVTTDQVEVRIVRKLQSLASPLDVCPGSLLQSTWCSDHGTCNTDTSHCDCDQSTSFGGRACHVPVTPLASAVREPDWNGSVPALTDSSILVIPPAGLVAKVSAEGSASMLSIRARVLVGGVFFKDRAISVSSGRAVVSMACKRWGEDFGSGSLQEGTDIPTPYDENAMATVAEQSAGGDSVMYELICVSSKDIPRDGHWLLGLFVTAISEEQGLTDDVNATVSVRVLRCGRRNLPPCPLGIGTASSLTLGVWVAIGVGIVCALVLLAAVVFWTCRKTFKGMHGSHTGSIIDGRFFQVVDHGKTSTSRISVGKPYAYKADNAEEEEEDDDDDGDGDRQQMERNGETRANNWESVWLAERERRRQQQQLELQGVARQASVGPLDSVHREAPSVPNTDRHVDMPVMMELP